MSRRYQGGFISGTYRPFLTPNAPTGVVAAGGIGQVTVSFTAPSNVGGAAITSYTVISSAGQVATGSSSPIVVTGLTDGVSYTFTVYASNTYGPGAMSAPSNSVAPGVVGQQAYTTPGTYTFTVPTGVTSICVVCVGGGGGGWSSGSGLTNVSAGGESAFNSSTCRALGGGGAASLNDPGGGGTVVAGTGVSGAAGLANPPYYAGGGGGAGTLAGTTAPNGANLNWNGGGGYGASVTSTGSNAGGSGDNGGENYPTSLGGSYGGGGGGGRDGAGGGGGAIAWVNNISCTPGQTFSVLVGVGGSPRGNGGRSGGYGGPGAVRIIWGGGRSFPSTNIGDL